MAYDICNLDRSHSCRYGSFFSKQEKKPANIFLIYPQNVIDTHLLINAEALLTLAMLNKLRCHAHF